MIMKQEKIEKPLHETFLQIVIEFGENILNESRLLGLLSDLGGREFNQYKFVVKCLLEKNIGNQILDMKDLDDSDRMLRIANLQQTIVEEYSLQEEKVKYIIDCYLYSLGFIERVNAEDGDMLENVESNDTESSSNKKPFKPDPFIFEELLTLFRKHSKIAAGNGRVSKRKEMSSLKINVTTFTQAVETKYGVTLDTPSFSSFLTVENLLDYIIEKYELKSVEHQTELTTDREQKSSWDRKTPQTPVSYIKIEDSSLTSLPVFAEILDIIRAIGYFDINEYTEASEYSWYNWYEKLPEKIQLHYGVRPELPPKERFETVGDLIKYIIHKYEIRNKVKPHLLLRNNISKKFSWNDDIPYIVSAVITLLFGFHYIHMLAEYSSVSGFWNSIGSSFTLICYFIGVPILIAVVYSIVFSDIYFGLLIRLYIYALILSIIPQWWLVLIAGIVEFFSMKNSD